METKFVVAINKYDFTIGRLNPTETWFYDFEDVELENCPDIKLGQEVLIENGNLTIINPVPNKRILNLLEKYRDYRLELSEKYKDTYKMPSTRKLFNTYLKMREENGKSINSFVANSTYVFCKVMGIKVKNEHSVDAYDKKGFEYPEDVVEVMNAIYKYIDGVIMHDTREHEYVIYNYDLWGKKNIKYENFKKWLSQNTHFPSYCFSSEVELRMGAYNDEHRSHMWSRALHSSSTIKIAPYKLVYIESYAGNEPVEKVLYSDNEYSEMDERWPFIDNISTRGKEKSKTR